MAIQPRENQVVTELKAAYKKDFLAFRDYQVPYVDCQENLDID
jgi:hypothetical protein